MLRPIIRLFRGAHQLWAYWNSEARVINRPWPVQWTHPTRAA